MAFGDCVTYGMEEADRIASFLSTAKSTVKKEEMKVRPTHPPTYTLHLLTQTNHPSTHPQQPRVPAGESEKPKTVVPTLEMGGGGGGGEKEAVPAARAE